MRCLAGGHCSIYNPFDLTRNPGSVEGGCPQRSGEENKNSPGAEEWVLGQIGCGLPPADELQNGHDDVAGAGGEATDNPVAGVWLWRTVQRSAAVDAYYRPGNQLYLYPDNGDGSQATSMVLNGDKHYQQWPMHSRGAGGQRPEQRQHPQCDASNHIQPKIWRAQRSVAGRTNYGRSPDQSLQALGAWAVPFN